MKRHPHEAAAVLFIDIDDFKVVNDCYGHAIGDALIKEVSNRLRACLRSDGTIARMGGDEFTVLVEDVTDPSDVIRVAERIQSSFERPFLLEGLEVVKSASIGRDICGGGASECRYRYVSCEKPRQGSQ
jgi:diguanylate cyclase (GGDEF)-like protein